MGKVWSVVAAVFVSGLFLAGCTAQLTQSDRDLLNQALEASKSAATSAQRAESAADRAEQAARRADSSAAQAKQSAAEAKKSASEAKKAFEMGLTK